MAQSISGLRPAIEVRLCAGAMLRRRARRCLLAAAGRGAPPSGRDAVSCAAVDEPHARYPVFEQVRIVTKLPGWVRALTDGRRALEHDADSAVLAVDEHANVKRLEISLVASGADGSRKRSGSPRSAVSACMWPRAGAACHRFCCSAWRHASAAPACLDAALQVDTQARREAPPRRCCRRGATAGQAGSVADRSCVRHRSRRVCQRELRLRASDARLPEPKRGRRAGDERARRAVPLARIRSRDPSGAARPGKPIGALAVPGSGINGRARRSSPATSAVFCRCTPLTAVSCWRPKPSALRRSWRSSASAQPTATPLRLRATLLSGA